MLTVFEIIGLVLLSMFTVGVTAGWFLRGKTLPPLINNLRLKFTIGPVEKKTEQDYKDLSTKKYLKTKRR